MSKQPVRKRLFRVFTLSLLVLLVGGGAALLYQFQIGLTATHASSDSVVRPPSLPAAFVNQVFARVGSPMAGTGQAVEAASRAQNIDDAFALAVWWTETSDGAAGVGLAYRNPGSVRGSIGYPSAADGYTIYPSYTAAVTYWFGMLKKNYIDRGLTTVSSIAHPYVGTSTSNLWAGKVISLMQTYRAETPPPTPTPTATPTLQANMVRKANEIGQRNALAQETPDPAQPQPQTLKPNQAITPAVTTGSTALSARTTNIIVLLTLIMALIVGLWAWSIHRRYSNREKIAHLLESEGIQQTLTGVPAPPPPSYGSYSKMLNNTGDLNRYTPNTDTLVASSDLPASSFLTEDPALARLIEASTEPLPSFAKPQPEYLPVAQSRAHTADQLSWPVMPISSAELEQPADQLAFPQPAMPYTNAWEQLQHLPKTPLPPVPQAATWKQEQQAGVAATRGRSNGLLSRYREMQTQDQSGEAS